MPPPELDYYGVLDVSREASKEEITLAYRKLAVDLCPFRDPKYKPDFVPLLQENHLTHMAPLAPKRQWDYINIAFSVLGNDLLRSIYDRYGEAGLFQGVPLPNGVFPPYQYHGNNMIVYQSVFGTCSPYANITDAVTQPPPLYSSKDFPVGKRTKDKDVEKIVELSLEEVYNGCVKIMQVWRQEFVDKERTCTRKMRKMLKLHIEPGVTAGTRYCFKEEGDRSPTTIPADIIFIIVDKPHNRFKRENLHNLVYTREIDLCQALTGFEFVIDSLDNRKLNICVNDVVKPEYKKILPFEGLPKCKNLDTISRLRPQQFESTEYGDLVIEFITTFPDYISNEMKVHVQTLFKNLAVMQKKKLANEK